MRLNVTGGGFVHPESSANGGGVPVNGWGRSVNGDGRSYFTMIVLSQPNTAPTSAMPSAFTIWQRCGQVYAQSDGYERFVRDFVKAWTQVTELDRFDSIRKQCAARRAVVFRIGEERPLDGSLRPANPPGAAPSRSTAHQP